MKVHLFVSRTAISNEPAMVAGIIKGIRERGHSLVRNWIDEVIARQQNNGTADPTIDWQDIYLKNVEDIAKSDVVIAESSHNSFAGGYQVACAIQQKKPTLILRKENDDNDAFSVGIADSWAANETYSDSQELDAIVTKFLENNDIQAKDMRFNFFMDRQIYNYLRWTSVKTGKSKAEILRELVEREISSSNS